jgi:hypothetical protein
LSWNDSTKHPVDAGGLVRGMLLSLAGALACCALLLVLVNRPESWRGLLAASVAMTVGLAASVPILLIAIKKGDQAAAAVGVLAAGGVRLIVASAACIAAVAAGGFPPADTLILLIPLYLSVLVAEAVILYRALWKASV